MRVCASWIDRSLIHLSSIQIKKTERTGSGLVQEQDGRVLDDGPSDGDPLLLPCISVYMHVNG